MKLTIEDAVKIIENISQHQGLTLSKTDHFLVGEAIILIKESLSSQIGAKTKLTKQENKEITG